MSTSSTKIHPLVATAAVAVILASLAGTASLMGWLPSGQDNDTPAAQTATPVTPGSDAGSVSTAPAPAANTPAPASPAASTAPAKRAQTPRQQAAQSTGATAPAAAPAQARSPAPVQAQPVCMDCGKVLAVRAVEQAAKPSGVGAVAGAVVGGVLGNQVGGGTGKTLATVAGAVGGGVAGNEIEKRTRKTTIYEVDVQMENGIKQSFSFEQQPSWREGDQVRVSNGTLVAR